MLPRIAALVACLALTSCAGLALRDTRTVTNPEATHIWIVQHDDGEDLVLYCDRERPCASDKGNKS